MYVYKSTVGSAHKYTSTGSDPGFQVRGGADFKKIRRAEGGAKIFGVFRLKNHDFTPKKLYFFQFKGPPLGSAPAVHLYIYSTYTKINPKVGVKHQSIN
jgi:hypothetical protein